MIKMSFTPEFLEWVAVQMRANDTGLDARQFATEFFHRAFVGRGAEVAAAAPPVLSTVEGVMLAALTEGIGIPGSRDFASDLGTVANFLKMYHPATAGDLRRKAQAIRAAIAAAKGES